MWGRAVAWRKMPRAVATAMIQVMYVGGVRGRVQVKAIAVIQFVVIVITRAFVFFYCGVRLLGDVHAAFQPALASTLQPPPPPPPASFWRTWGVCPVVGSIIGYAPWLPHPRVGGASSSQPYLHAACWQYRER